MIPPSKSAVLKDKWVTAAAAVLREQSTGKWRKLLFGVTFVFLEKQTFVDLREMAPHARWRNLHQHQRRRLLRHRPHRDHHRQSPLDDKS